MPSRVISSLVVFGVLTFVGSASACGGDDDGEDADPGPSEVTTTTTSQPPGDDPAAVEPYVVELLARFDEVTDQIVRDPSVVEDPESPLIEQLEAIYAPDAEGMAGSLQAFRRDADAGLRSEPVNSDTTIRTDVTGEVETVDENTVTVPVCSVMTYRRLDRDGAVHELIAYLAQPGEVTAVRVEGVWRLERVDVFGNTICQDPVPA